MRPPDSWSKARVTLAVVAVTSLAWLAVAVLQLNAEAAVWVGFIPGRLAFIGRDDGLAPFWITPLTATLVHANLIHILFNMVMLVFCGRPVEAVLGRINFAIIYLLGAYGAAAAQYFADPSALVPMVGASGAISSVLGAYAMLFGRNKVKVASPRLALLLNALWLLAAWIGLSLMLGIILQGGMIGGSAMTLAVAAHVGGFLVGLILANPLLLFRYRKA
jgi:membrane associated rhomboid family serine protease